MSHRKSWSYNEEMMLFNEVDGMCPLCGKPLTYNKNGKIYKNINIAHIYPHSPTKQELELFMPLDRINDDADHIDNVICLCPECHLKFDKPRTTEEYNELLEIKRQLIQDQQIKIDYYSHQIENDIKQILDILSNDQCSIAVAEFEYDPALIDKKIDSTLRALTKRKIKYHVSEYYNIIKHEFNRLSTTKSEQIAIQVKLFYLKLCEKSQNQELIYGYMVDWLHSKTKVSEEASSIIISFFVQNCEVFRVISK
ncbi:MAG: HNH endonuclease [Burkholderiales bacterium]|nr:HNH endonuclease [Burkholderiales bacterium]